MDLDRILSAVDHTLLSADASWEDIRTVCDDGIKYKVASVCIPPSFVKDAAAYAAGRIPICTVAGFPNGYSTTAAKCFEAGNAIENGASEIDIVINIGWLKDKKYDLLEHEISEIKKVCGKRILKVIIETCLLDEQEKIKMCGIISNSGADFIKTSTGFSKAGAAREDIILFKKHVEPHVKIKAAGGISSLADAEDFLKLGASRLGTSRIIKIVKNMEMEKDRGAY